jgi:tetratricopeptide (TPR) repeat protein
MFCRPLFVVLICLSGVNACAADEPPSQESILKDIEEVTAEISQASSPLSELYEERGDLYMLIDGYESARNDYTESIKCSKFFPYDQLEKRRDVSLKLEDYRQALTDAASAANVRPSRARPFAILAIILAGCPDEKLRDPARAVRLAESASRIPQHKSELVTVQFALAAAYSATGDFDAAIKCQEQAISLLKEVDPELKKWLERYKKMVPFRLGMD